MSEQEMDADIKLINLETISNEELNGVLSEYFVEGETDEDGDIFINRTVRFFIRVDLEQKVLRMFGFIPVAEEEINSEELIERVDLRNTASSTVKYSKLKKSIMAEYGLPLSGHVDHKHLIKTIEHFESQLNLLKIVISKHLKG